MDAAKVDAEYAQWKKAVTRTFGWVELDRPLEADPLAGGVTPLAGGGGAAVDRAAAAHPGQSRLPSRRPRCDRAHPAGRRPGTRRPAGRILESLRTMAGSASSLVGIVVVSHSSRLAEGVVELATQMADPGLALSAVGGTADGRLGTDATRIAATIRSANSGAGVAVLADLGSAILAAEAAIETLDPELSSRVRISGGPIAEARSWRRFRRASAIRSRTSCTRPSRRPARQGVSR